MRRSCSSAKEPAKSRSPSSVSDYLPSIRCEMSVPEFAARPQLSDDVARLIRRRIFDGSYAAGSYVRLDQLAAELGISVTPVREALFALRAEGLISQQPRRGFVVLPVTGRDVTDVANVQAHVGGELAARAAINITDDQLRELNDIQA